MSKLETPMTRAYWTSTGGTLVEEFPLVRRSATASARWADGLIISNEERRIARPPDVSIEDRDVIVVQTKARRLGMYLLGQALFSKELLKAHNPRSIRAVAVCADDDSVLRPLAERYGIEIQVIRPDELALDEHEV